MSFTWIRPVAACLAVALAPCPIFAQDAAWSGPEIARKINARDAGQTVEQILQMQLTDRRGNVIERELHTLRKYFGDDRKTVVYFTGPKNIMGTAFLTFDYADGARDDDQWLYLPAARKIRRISASDRGGAFFGTDFTYEDIKNGTKVSFDEFEWTSDGSETCGEHTCLLLAGTARDEAAARELGYGRVRLWVDPEIWIPRRFRAWDVGDNLLKTIEISDIRRVDDVWTPYRLDAENHKTGHRTAFVLLEVKNNQPIDDDLFEQNRLRRGLR